MVEIPDALQCLFNGTVQEHDGTYVIEVPRQEVTNDIIMPGDTYRIGVLAPPAPSPTESGSRAPQRQPSGADATTVRAEQGPPVEAGEIRTVTIESIGTQGDGIAKVDGGYVVIVPGAQPGDEVTVEIDDPRDNVAFAQVIATDQ